MSQTQTLLPFEKHKREVLVRREASTDAKFGCRPEERSVEDFIVYGVINVNKPKGPTSHQVSAYVQKILGINKSGHSGTLDPKVTGVLPIATARATRIVQALLPSGKEYVCIMHLHSHVKEGKVKEALESFVGRIKQLPPVRSAVKRAWRYRKIYYIEVIEVTEQDVLFRIGCQAGTYIRKLCHDIGEKLGVGAHMAELIRTKAGPFNESDMVMLQDIEDALHYYKEEGKDTFIKKVIKPVEFAVSHLPKVWITDPTVEPLCHGTNLAVPGIAKVESDMQVDERVAVMTLKDELVAIGTIKMISKEMIDEEKGIAVQIEKVFMEPGTYPRISL